MCVCLEFAISLHAARRAMAAACRCPRGQQPFLHPHYMTRSCPQPLWVKLGQPNLLLPRSARQRKGYQGNQKKRKERRPPRAGPARPRSPALGPPPHPCPRRPWPWPTPPRPGSPLSCFLRTPPPPRQRHPSTATSALVPSGAPTRNPFLLSATVS